MEGPTRPATREDGMQIVHYDATRLKVIQTGAQRIEFRAYVGEAAGYCEGPQVFMVELFEPGSRIEPHFHDVDQFQIVLRGGGHLGSEATEPVSFHYADAYTPYGPIVSRGEGISFLTIRAAAAGAFFPMPASRHLLPGLPGRNITGAFPSGGPRRAGVGHSTVLLETDDGARVTGLALGPGAEAEPPPADAGRQYYLVCSGSASAGNEVLRRWSIVELEPGEGLASLRAGPGGAEILVAQLPRASDRPGSDVLKLAERKIDYVLPPGSTYD